MKELNEFNEGLQWKAEEAESIVIGVTQIALDLAGAISEMDMSDVGDEFDTGDWIGEIRGKNAVVDLLAPCRLRVTERNEEVLAQPSLIEDDPTGDAWVVRVECLDG